MKDCAVARMHPTHSFNALLSLLRLTEEKSYSAHSGDVLLYLSSWFQCSEKYSLCDIMRDVAWLLSTH